MLKKNIRKKIIKIRSQKYKKGLIISLKKINKILLSHKKKKIIIGGYYPSNYEIDCLKILKILQNKGHKISLPVIKNKSQMDFYEYNNNDPLMVNKFGILEPKPNNLVFPDIIFVPMVAFDKSKSRLGYGGGYYDRYISRAYDKNKIIKIGVGFSYQKVKKVSINRYDKKMNFIITEKDFFKWKYCF